MRSMGASASAVIAPALAPEVPVRGWVFGFPVSGLGPAGLGQHASHDWCCACCHGQLPSPFPSSGPSILPICPLCLASDVPPSRVRQAALLNPYVPSGEPVHIVFTFSVPAERPLCKSVAGRLGTRALPWLRFDDCSGAVMWFSFPSPNPCAFPSLEGPNPNLQISGQPCHATAEGSQLGLFSDTCVACGCEPTLAASGFREARLFYQACMRVHLAGPSAQLAVALHDCGQFCAGCLCHWSRKCAAARPSVTEGGSSLLSGPKFFPQVRKADHWSGSVGATSFHARAEEHDLVEQSDLHEGSLCLRMGQPGAGANAWEHDLQLDRGARWASCRSPELRSRRSRRRRNRRQRIEGAQAAVGVCGQATSAVRGVGPAVSLRGDASPVPFSPSCVRAASGPLANVIEPLLVQGAPKAQEEVMSGRWTIQQELGGPMAVGLGGPDCVSLPSLLDGPADVRPVGCTRKATHIIRGSTHCPVDEAIPLPCTSAQDAVAQDQCVRRSEGALGCSTDSVGMRPSVFTRPDTYVGGAGPGSSQSLAGKPAPVSDMWDSMIRGLSGSCESEVVQAISALEDAGLLVQDTFPWTAAEMALNAVQDSHDSNLVAAALAALQDVRCNLDTKPERQPLQILSFNATAWRPALAPWCAEQRPDLVLVQETHLDSGGTASMIQQMGHFGYRVTCAPAARTGRGGTSGGLAIFCRSHLDARLITEQVQDGAGFLAVALRVQGCDLFVVTVYLKSGEGFQSAANAALLGRLIPFLRSVRGAYLAAGDYNEDFETLVNTNVASEAKGTWVGPGCPTLVGGGQIDFGLVSRSLAPFTSVSLDWATPFKPHAALRWQMDVGAVTTHVPSLSTFRPAEPKPQPFQECSGRAVPSLFEAAVSPLTSSFADLSQAAEQSVYGATQGRGVRVSIQRGPLPVQGQAQMFWGGRGAALWSRVVGWLSPAVQQGCSPKAFPRKLLWQLKEAGLVEDCDGQRFLDTLQQFSAGITVLDWAPHLVHAVSQHKQLAERWVNDQASVYSQWLLTATQAGMRPLFRSVRKHEESFDRPFRDKSLLDRVYHRWMQWHSIWCQQVDAEPALFESLKAKAIEQASSLPAISLQAAVKYFRQLPLKAPGLDGWTPHMVRQLGEAAIQAVLDFFRACELCAEWPAQFALNLIVLLPKSVKRERPIALLHILYRAYVRLRWHLIARWQVEYSRVGFWDKATPGSGVLDVALSRLVRAEIAKRHKQHLCTLFVDLETFYDRCRFPDIIRSGLSLGYPPLILHQALLVYQGGRYLSAENTVAPCITPTTGVLAGCPAAPSITKLIIHPVAAALTGRRGATNLDVWLDDLSLDCVHNDPQQLASTCVRLYRGLAISLGEMGAKVSLDKTCFVASSAAAAKALNAIRRPDDPPVRPLSRDLGITSNGARRRVLGLAASRRAKAGARSNRLNKLAVKAISHRVRVVKAAIVAAGLWGHQAIGVSPKRRKWYRTLCGRHLGRQRLGSIDCVFAIFEKRCEDPHFTILRQHLRAVCRVFQRWHQSDPAKFASTWLGLWHHLSSSPSAWKRVSGPVSATIAYLLDLGVVCEKPDLWQHPAGDLHLRWSCKDAARAAWAWVEKLLRAKRLERISSQEGCFSLRQGVDFTVPRQLARRRHVRADTLTGLQAVWQGALVSASKPGFCTRCRCALSLEHVLWQCPFIAEAFHDDMQEARQEFPWPSLWLRGLVPLQAVRHPVPSPGRVGVCAEGIFASGRPIQGEGLVFASDGTAGPGGSDSRLRLSCWAIGAYALDPSGPRRVGSLTCLQPFELTVPQTEQRAVFELLQRVQGEFDLTIDCKSVQQLLHKSSPPAEGPIPWGEVWDRRHWASITWVNSHKDAAHFDAQGWPQWRREINADVDALCQRRCQLAYQGSHKLWLKRVDGLAREVSYALARKANFILRHRKDPGFPWTLGRSHTASQELSLASPTQKVIPSAAFKKHAVPNKRQRMLACIAAEVDTLGHQWVKGAESGNNLTMKCSKCALYVQQISNLAVFNRLMLHHCLDGQGVLPSEWNVHASHNMVNMGVQWSCTRCGRLQRPHLEAGSAALQKPCDGRAKAGKIARQAQGVGTSKLSPATASVHVHKVKVPFGTKKAQPDLAVQRPSQSVLMFGQPAVVVEPRSKSKAAAPGKQTKLVFPKG